MKLLKKIYFGIRTCWLWIKMLWSEFYVQIFILFIMLLLYILINRFICVRQDDLLKLLGSVLTIMVGLFVYKAQKRVLNWDIRNRLICEFDEIYRHLQRNLEVLDAMNKSLIGDQKVSVMHIEKLRIVINQTFTDEELLKNMNKKYTFMVFPLNVRMKNYNITVNCLKEALEKNKKDLFKSYLNEIIIITEKLQESILKDSDEKLVYKIVCEPRPPRVLVFDGNW